MQSAIGEGANVPARAKVFSQEQALATGVPGDAAPIHAATARLERNLDALHEALSDLERRLHVVMKPAVVDAIPGKENAPSAVSQLTETIQDHCHSVDMAHSRIVGILDRLDV